MNRYLEQKEDKHHAFFAEIIHQLHLHKTQCDLIAVVHALPDVVPLYRAFDKVFHVACLVPKPRSINEVALGRLPSEVVVRWKREELTRYDNVRWLLQRGRHDRFVFSDIGGYFAGAAHQIKAEFGDRFAGIVEDTENGLQKYRHLAAPTFSVFQVARSPIKGNEDYMVGRAIAFSAESLLRNISMLVNGARVGVIGFGKIGRSVAEELRHKQGEVAVYDIDPVRMTYAYSRGFVVPPKEQLLANSDIVCLATGNQSLLRDEFGRLRNGAFVFSVTSSDDEIDLSWVQANYKETEVAEHVHRYSNGAHSFYLFNRGNAINFIHGTTVGDFILLVHAEILVCAHRLATSDQGSGFHDLDDAARGDICKVWLSMFAR
jgi:adenosylhomocysteinase